jgi:hypothetical protein
MEIIMKLITKTALAGSIIAGALTAFPAQSAIITSYSNTTYGVFDSSTGSRSVTVTAGDVAPGAGTLLDVNITVEFSKCGGGNIGPSGSLVCPDDSFSFNNEIVFQLRSPGGAIIYLVEVETFSGQEPGAGRLSITFDDEATGPAGGSAIVAGSFNPVQALSAFDGENAIGEWTLTLVDTVPNDPLEFFSFVLTLTTDVPEPITLSLFGAGLAGMAMLRRRRSLL